MISLNKTKTIVPILLSFLFACGERENNSADSDAAHRAAEEAAIEQAAEHQLQQAQLDALTNIAVQLDNMSTELRNLAIAQATARSEPKISEPVFGEATSFTREANNALLEVLPFDNRSDFEDASRGLIGQIPGGRITADDGRVVWDLSRFAFLEGEAPATVNPSLWRQSVLNMEHGLFEVVPGLYQIRGYDLAVMTIIEGKKGWIIIDPLLTKETARASLALVNKHLGQRPVSTIIYTHSHADHFGGVRGIVSDEEIEKGRVQIIGPEGVDHHAISENIIAGNAMSRRAQFQFGANLDISATGRVDAGIGKGLSAGTIGFMEVTKEIATSGERVMIDGVEFAFVMAQGTEAPAEFVFYLPRFKAIHSAEIATGTLHNLLTPRGAEVRDALAWSEAIDALLVQFGDKAEVVLASHNWPTWGNAELKEYLGNQRDLYRYIHDQTLRLANMGYTMHEIPPLLGEPEFMRQEFSTRGYYGSVSHNVRATYQKYFGWWDGNPANLDPLPPEEEARRLVNLAGGAEKMLLHAVEYYNRGDYRWASKLLNSLVFADPSNEIARKYLSSCYEQLGYQNESAIFRNYYLAAAVEVREGGPAEASVRTVTEDFISAVPTHQYFDALAVRVNPELAQGSHSIHFNFSDTGEQLRVSVKNGTATHLEAAQPVEGDLHVQLSRVDLDEITLGTSTFQSKLANGAIQVEGGTEKFLEYLSLHTQFNPQFNVVTP